MVLLIQSQQVAPCRFLLSLPQPLQSLQNKGGILGGQALAGCQRGARPAGFLWEGF
jgi:hypothetical protein